jgi:AraC-like DNA-binding protein/ligand-binding sensor protein
VNIDYDKNKIKTALGQFTKATGINAVFIKKDFSQLEPDIKRQLFFAHNYCNSIQSTEKGRLSCQRSDEILLLRCAKSRKPETHICHAGLVDVAVPLIYHAEIIGYLVLGQMREETAFSCLESYLRSLSLDLEVMKKQYDELTVFDPLKIESIVSIAEMLAKYLLFENSLRPSFGYGVQEAVDYINSNLKEKMTINKISHESGLSKNTLYRGFMKEFGMTIGEYITEKRIEKAEKLLLETDLSVEEIAFETGFSGSAYFGANFKKARGISPLKFRKTRS